MSSGIEEALKSARYNEAVVVSVDEDDTRDLVLVATLDEENGGITWKDVLAEGNPSSDGGDRDDSADIALQRHLRTKRWFLPMLNDDLRNELYDKAIAKAARKAATNVVNAKRNTLQVLDIGTGTGLLAMLAAKHCRAALDELPNGSDVKIRVTSIEMASAMARLGRLTIAENGRLEDIITVMDGHSSDPNFDLKNEVDLCTSELLESGLLGEGVVPALRDAWQRHLRPDAVVVPIRARVFAQVLEGKDTVACYRGPSAPEPCPEGVERLCLSSDHRDVLLGGPGRGGIRHPIRGEALFEKMSPDSPLCDYELAKELSEPVQVLDFDLSDPEGIPSEVGRKKVRQSIPAIASGTAHGVLFWWELDMEDDVTYTTEPSTNRFQDHWQQCLWVFGQDDDQCPKLAEGAKFSLVASHNDFEISFFIDEKVSDDAEPPPAKQQKVESDTDTINKYISPDRAMQLNDKMRLEVFRSVVASALREKGKTNASTTMLHLGDFSLCAIMAGVMADGTGGNLQISSLESSSGNLPLTAATVAQIGNNLPRQGTNFQVLQAHAENLTLPLIDPGGNSSPDIVCAEPYYEMLEGWHVQEALNLFYTLRMLRRKGIVQSSCSVMPKEAKILGCAVQLDGIGEAYRGGYEVFSTNFATKVSEASIIRGFEHEAALSHAGRYHTFSANFPLWQYHHTFLSKPFELATLPYHDGGEIRRNGEVTKCEFTQEGMCDGIVFWVDYTFRSKDGADSVMSTLTRSHKQGVQLLKARQEITNENIKYGIWLSCKATFGGLDACEDQKIELLQFTSKDPISGRH